MGSGLLLLSCRRRFFGGGGIRRLHPPPSASTTANATRGKGIQKLLLLSESRLSVLPHLGLPALLSCSLPLP